MKKLTQKQTLEYFSINRDVRPARFNEVFCSQCGRGFGAGNYGYSHCKDHSNKRVSSY